MHHISCNCSLQWGDLTETGDESNGALRCLQEDICMTEKSAIAEHVLEDHHSINWNISIGLYQRTEEQLLKGSPTHSDDTHREVYTLTGIGMEVLVIIIHIQVQ